MLPNKNLGIPDRLRTFQRRPIAERTLVESGTIHQEKSSRKEEKAKEEAEKNFDFNSGNDTERKMAKLEILKIEKTVELKPVKPIVISFKNVKNKSLQSSQVLIPKEQAMESKGSDAERMRKETPLRDASTSSQVLSRSAVNVSGNSPSIRPRKISISSKKLTTQKSLPLKEQLDNAAVEVEAAKDQAEHRHEARLGRIVQHSNQLMNLNLQSPHIVGNFKDKVHKKPQIFDLRKIA